MTKYVALLRGIGPTNPNMRGEKLTSVLEDLGFHTVQTVITSGNVLFESDMTDISAMEEKIERAWPEKLGFTSRTIIRSQEQLNALVSRNPFPNMTHSPKTYLFVTFFKQLPSGLTDNFYIDRGVNALCSIIDTTTSKTPDFMYKLEKQFSKDITSRTWKTIERILRKMGD
jgi:uncharacterized protein (DUF1697 family)